VSLYLIVLGILCIAALDEGFIKRRSNNRLYLPLFLIMALMLCLRYGQGTDYLGYKYAYVNMPIFNSISEVLSNRIHGELGWKLLCSICNNYLKMPFEIFVIIISIVEMYSLNRFIKRYCPRRILALLIFYPTYYLTYYFSALRQGLVLSIFLGFLLEYCINKEYRKYYISVLILALIHSAALILIILPLIHTFRLGLKKSLLLIMGCFVIGSIIGFTGLKTLLPYSTSSFSPIAIAERMVSFIVIIMVCAPLYNKLLREDSKNIFIGIMNIYLLGLMLYGISYTSDTLSGRIIIFFKCMELVLFGYAANYRIRKDYQVAYVYSILLAVVMTVKNIDSYIGQLKYVDSVSVMNYPYISLFNPERIAQLSNSIFVDYFH